MAYITTFVYCEEVLIDNSQGVGKMNIANPLQVMTPMFIPSMYSFSIVVGILEFDITKAHTIKVIFRNRDTGEVVIDTPEANLPGQPINGDMPLDIQGMMMNTGFKNIALRTEGVYETKIIFDGEELGVYPIKVKGVQ